MHCNGRTHRLRISPDCLSLCRYANACAFSFHIRMHVCMYYISNKRDTNARDLDTWRPNDVARPTPVRFDCTPKCFCCAECPKCARIKTGEVTCCGQGGSWQGKCGRIGDKRFQHTWVEGEKACSTALSPADDVSKSTTPESISTGGKCFRSTHYVLLSPAISKAIFDSLCGTRDVHCMIVMRSAYV